MMDLAYWAPVMIGGLVAGGSTGLLGVYVVGMRIPLLAICVSHAALAGAVYGSLAGLTGPMLLAPALAAAGGTALLLGLLNVETFRADANVVLGLLFSLMMGLSFLGIGLTRDSRNEVLGLLWGSVALLRWNDVYLMLGGAAAIVIFVALFYKEMRAILFSRLHAAAAGVHATGVWTGFLVLASVLLTVNFQTVGGLMIYSLMTNPAVAAFLLVRGYGRTIALSVLLGALSGLGGFLIACVADLPTGAMIVIFSSLLVVVAAVIAHLRRRAGAG